MTKKKKPITPEEPKLFEKFWDKYAMKLDRIGAVRAWNNLDKDLRREAIDGIQRYREICETLGVKRMWPQGYLNHRRWEDESPTPGPSPVGRGETAANDIPIQGGARGADIHLQGGQRGADLPDMAIW